MYIGASSYARHLGLGVGEVVLTCRLQNLTIFYRNEGATPVSWFDQPIVQFVNSFAHHFWLADAVIVEISKSNFVDGAVLMAMLWWAWVEFGKKYPEKREILVADLGVCAMAVVGARILALSLPYRERPIHEPLLNFKAPYTASSNVLIHWSSFPSDHAVLAFCIATGLGFASRRLGAVAIAYAAATTLPRIYSGAHYPTDILVGVLIGVGAAYLAKTSPFRNAARACLNFLEPHPPYMYALLFAWTFEIAEMFDSLRHAAAVTAKGIMRFPAGQVEAVGIPLLVVLASLLVWIMWQRRKNPA
jgi:undecaprenyl-diphosphatase